LGRVSLVFPAWQESSIARTRAFTSLYLAATALAAICADRNDLFDELSRLPEVCCRLLSDYGALARKLGSDAALDRFYFLGSGPRYGLACEPSLKMKEMSLSHSELCSVASILTIPTIWTQWSNWMSSAPPERGWRRI
jgi:glucosamine--fructose-6-phosphate aminotransferase (isomerizing)